MLGWKHLQAFRRGNVGALVVMSRSLGGLNLLPFDQLMRWNRLYKGSASRGVYVLKVDS